MLLQQLPFHVSLQSWWHNVMIVLDCTWSMITSLKNTFGNDSPNISVLTCPAFLLHVLNVTGVALLQCGISRYFHYKPQYMSTLQLFVLLISMLPYAWEYYINIHMNIHAIQIVGFFENCNFFLSMFGSTL